jgi:hypothetical protein
MVRSDAGVLVLVLACKPTQTDEVVTGSTTGECEGDAGLDEGSADAVEGPLDPGSTSSAATELPACVYDLAYGPCSKICQGYAVDGVHCPSFFRAGEGYEVCAIDCESVDDCPPAPDGHPVLCDLGSCFMDCSEHDCPEGSACVQFGFDAEPTAPWVCMIGP